MAKPSRSRLARRLFLGTLALAMALPLAAANVPPPPPDLPPTARQRPTVHLAATLPATAPARAKIAPDDLTDAHVKKAIADGANYLLASLEHADKLHWARTENAAGIRLLMLYALLSAGRTSGDPRLTFRSREMAPEVEWILKYNTDRTYEASLQALCLGLLPQKEPYNAKLKAVHRKLIEGVVAEGGYTYVLDAAAIPAKQKETGRKWDNSNTQYGLLGVWAGADARHEVPTNYWRFLDAHWRRTQLRDGGWDYDTFEPGSTPSMTAAGVASLFVTTEHLYPEARLTPRTDRHLELGMDALARSFDPDVDDLYYLFSLERVALASGRKHLGKHNWYRSAGAAVVSRQLPNGGWSSRYHWQPRPANTPPGIMSNEVSTAYAVLFLARGRAPVAMNKLQYDGPWNTRERDSAFLTQWMSHRFETPIHWQIVSIDTDPDEWNDAPILLITGNRDPKFTPEQLAKLRRFAFSGGLIFSSADGNSQAFTEAVKKAASTLAGGAYEMRDLPQDHPIFTVSNHVRNTHRLMGISNGVREFWVHSPVDMGATWQTRRTTRVEHWTIPENLFFYATGKVSPRQKLERTVIPPPPEGNVPARVVQVARIFHNGNHDPEPLAWPRFSRIVRRDLNTDLDLVELKPRQLRADRTPIAHLTGTAAFTLGDEDRVRLKMYIDGGGTLLADAAGGSDAFGKSFIELVNALYPNALVPIPKDDRLYDGSIDGSVKIKDAAFRKAVLLRDGPQHKPRLLGVKVNGRWAVIYSQDDILTGVLDARTWGILGYTPQTASDLLRNALLYALHPPKEPG